MDSAVTLNEVLALVKRLSPLDKVRLIEHVAPQIERELKHEQSAPRVPLRGLWKGLNITERDIDQARRDMWSDFPRKDI